MEETINRLKVSVVVPTFNHEDYIGATLQSIVEQELEADIEILVGDDASTDRTSSIIRRWFQEYSESIRPTLRETNVGGQRNRNLLYTMARGEFVVVLDGDDVMYPGKLREQIRFLDANPECDSVFHQMDFLVDGSTNGKFVGPKYEAGQYGIESFVTEGTFLPHSSKMFRRRCLPDGGFPEHPELRGLDWLHHMITSENGAVGYLSETYGAYRKHGDSNTAQRRRGELWRYFRGHRLALEYAGGTSVASDIVYKGNRRLAYTYLRAALIHDDFDVFREVAAYCTDMRIQFSLGNRVLLMWWAHTKAVFKLRVWLRRVVGGKGWLRGVLGPR